LPTALAGFAGATEHADEPMNLPHHAVITISYQSATPFPWAAAMSFWWLVRHTG
jgi:hypothetical protein